MFFNILWRNYGTNVGGKLIEQRRQHVVVDVLYKLIHGLKPLPAGQFEVREVVRIFSCYLNALSASIRKTILAAKR